MDSMNTEQDPDFVEEYLCPICSKDLSTSSLYFRTLHLNNCLENSNRVTKETSNKNEKFIPDKIYIQKSTKNIYNSSNNNTRNTPIAPKNCSKSKKKVPRTIEDEQTEIAVAMSKSLVTMAIDKLPKSFRSKVDTNKPAPILMTDSYLSREIAIQKAGEIILQNSTTIDEPLTPTILKASKIQNKYLENQSSNNMWNLAKGVDNIQYQSQPEYSHIYPMSNDNSNRTITSSDTDDEIDNKCPTSKNEYQTSSPDSLFKDSVVGMDKSSDKIESSIELNYTSGHFLIDLQDSYLKLVGEENLCDLHIICKENISIPAHKLIISSRAPFLMKLVDCINTETIKLLDFSYDSVISFLKYIYSGFSDFNPKDTHSLIELANLCKIKKLEVYLSKLLKLHSAQVNIPPLHNSIQENGLNTETSIILANKNRIDSDSIPFENIHNDLKDLTHDHVNPTIPLETEEYIHPQECGMNTDGVNNKLFQQTQDLNFSSIIKINESFEDYKDNDLGDYYNQASNDKEITLEPTIPSTHLSSQNKSSTPIVDFSSKSISFNDMSLPHFSLMETPKLKSELECYGVRPLPKHKMVLLLKEIAKNTKSSQIKKKSNKKTETKPEANSKKSNLNLKKSTKQATSEELLNLFKNDPSLLLDSLIFKKFNLKTLQEYIKEKGIKCSKSSLKSFLDLQCINYSFTSTEKKEYNKNLD